MNDPPRDAPDVIAPPPLIYLGMIAAGFLLDSFWTLRLALVPYQNLAGIAVVVLGLGLSARSVIEFVRHGTHPDPRRPTTALIRSGPFRWSRNPIYLAFAIVHLGGRLCRPLPIPETCRRGIVRAWPPWWHEARLFFRY